ncbi:GntR family transcriptional regulator [Gracilibacillus caseinilyticus]|uniref:GntR family transcriptional regulator n=1 Tax=Gracilibacillus caseinilyticus TaxID=2932256 RepID=A0ABY4EVG5_9BACI|nr:GntR family transcriptional regulator [Gracilibacillus caseinilyticus]UOQ48061.1 GntR family transcriptional regulator [Gracilibacillus caseinilyticus]
MFELDLRSRKPIYEQLVDKLKQLIINDVLKQDEKLPSVRMLAQQLAINPNTIQKAYRELETQGFIYSVKGKGSFVNHMIVTDNTAEVKQVKDQLKKQIAEALFLGVSISEIEQLIREVDQAMRGDKDDSSSKRD